MNEPLKPLRGEVLMKRCNNPCDPHENGSALVVVKRELNDSVPWFEVVAVSEHLTEDIVVGDKVMVKLTDYTQPFRWEGDTLVATHESKILLVYREE